MFQSIKQLDTSLFLYLNSLHNSFFDQAMWLASDKFVWIPLYIWFLWLLYRKYPKHFWVVVITIALMILAGDQLSRTFKDFFGRFRPTHEPSIQQLVHTVNGYMGGSYSFFSGHATNSFAVAFFIICMLPDSRKFIIPVALA
jgi:undecaprenyl-diphosphatase